MRDICGICHGSGSLFCMRDGKARWFSCPQCNGVGTVRCYAAYTMKTRVTKNRPLAKLNQAIDAGKFPNFAL